MKQGFIVLIEVGIVIVFIRNSALLVLTISPLFGISGPESYYRNFAAEALDGEIEVSLPDGSRCDIVTEEYAIEVEKAANWHESLGQSLNYAFQSNKKAGILLIIHGESDSLKLMSLITHYQLSISVWTIHSETLEVKKSRIEEWELKILNRRRTQP